MSQVAGFCIQCGLPRVPSSRYCVRCGFDYGSLPDAAPPTVAPAQQTADAAPAGPTPDAAAPSAPTQESAPPQAYYVQQWPGAWPGAAPAAGGKRKLVALIAIGVVLVLVVAGGGFLVLSNSSSQSNTGANTPKSDSLSESDYKAACTEIPVSELTQQADADKGKLVRLTGKLESFEQIGTGNGPHQYNLIIYVTDDAHTNSSGLLPVLATYQGTTDVWIYDTVTIYGEVYGNFAYKGVQTSSTVTYPRVDARFVVKEG
jgi:hypothetical protein